MKQYFTFGESHEFSDSYIEIEGESFEECREKMWKLFEARWAFQYSEPPKASYGLFKLTPEDVIKIREDQKDEWRNRLIEEGKDWLYKNKLPQHSMDEVAMISYLTGYQQQYVKYYIIRWDEMEGS